MVENKNLKNPFIVINLYQDVCSCCRCLIENKFSSVIPTNRAALHAMITMKEKPRKYYLCENSFADALLNMEWTKRHLFFSGAGFFISVDGAERRFAVRAVTKASSLGFGDAGAGNEWGHPSTTEMGFCVFCLYRFRTVKARQT